MNKHGFTLAEVLVTLGIIGVVAALTTPALIQNVGNAKVGPKLQKAKATFETAAEMMITEESANSILGVASTSQELGDMMSRHMKITRNDAGNYRSFQAYNGGANNLNRYVRYDSDDGMIYWIRNYGAKETVSDDYPDITNNQLVGEVLVDVDGAQGRNTAGKDLFQFFLYNDGTLRPSGATGYMRSSERNASYWNVNHGCSAEKVNGMGFSCTGSIFENGMKIIYE